MLNDKRLAGFDLEAKGHFTAPDRFQVDPIHTRAMLVHKDGQAKLITYWCDICSIRTYSPGLCWCCQQETTLDLRDPDDARSMKNCTLALLRPAYVASRQLFRHSTTVEGTEVVRLADAARHMEVSIVPVDRQHRL